MDETVEPQSQTTQNHAAAETFEFGAMGRLPQISYSTLAAEEAKRIATRYYGFPSTLSCIFYNRGFNDTYRLSLPKWEFALRISQAKWKARPALMAELDVVNHIHAKGINVALPIRRADGGWITEIMAPDGVRRAIISRWAKGSRPKCCELHARQFGRHLARVHTALDDLAPLPALPNMDANYLLRMSLDAIYPAIASDPELLREFEDLGDRLGSRLNSAHKILRDWGACHGDVGNHNAHIIGDSCVLFDFEFCGWGWRLSDLASYRINSRFEGFEMQTWTPFIQEYLALRPGIESQLRYIGLFMCLRHLWVAARRTERLTEMGASSVPDTYYEMVVRLCKELESEFP